MNRRDAIKAMAGLAAASAWAGRARAFQAPPEDVPLPEMIRKLLPMMDSIPIQVERLTPELAMISGPGGNVARLAGPDGVVVVDSFVAAAGRDLGPILVKNVVGPVWLINTHWHTDHTGGNAALAVFGARIFAHENTRKRLATEQYVADFEVKVPPAPPAALPTVTIGDGATFHLNGEEIHLAHAPESHTDGDLFIHFRKANILHTGDLFTKGSYPIIDSSSGGWIGGMVAAADRILGLVDASTRIIPGHGPVANRDDLRAFRDMLAQAHARVEPLLAAGKTVDEAIAARPLAALDARWGQGPFKGTHFTRIVYSGLAAHRARSRDGGGRAGATP
jgi:cyclase